MPTKRKTQHLEEIQSPAAIAAPGSANSSHLGNNSSEAHLREQLEIFNNNTTPNPNAGAQSFARGGGIDASNLVPAPSAHDFANGTSPPPDALPAVSSSDPEAHIHPDLRARTAFTSAPSMMSADMQTGSVSPSVPPPGPSPAPQVQTQTVAHPHPQPDIQPPGHSPPGDDPMAIDDGAGLSLDGRKAKRELSQSKRAAQNRAAQRAFRQRKEGYIKKLEQQVRDFTEMEGSYKQLQSENYALREYVIHLQSRLVDTQGEYPQPPPNVNLSPSAQGGPITQEPQVSGPPTVQGSEAPPQALAPSPHIGDPHRSGAGAPLDAVAQAVAGLAAQEQLAERQQYPVKDYGDEPIKQDRHDGEDVEGQMEQDVLAAPTASM